VLSVITAIIGSVLLGVGLVGYLFRSIGLLKRGLFLLAAVGLLIPVVHTGQFAVLTWATNGVGLSLAIVLIAMEWMARAPALSVPAALRAGSTD
jgi:TRAP-type uncharacterized transport system fused permease subunit